MQISVKAKEAIAKLYGTKYNVGNIAQAICKYALLICESNSKK